MTESIQSLFGIKCKKEELKILGLPVYMTMGRKAYLVTAGEKSFVMIEIKAGDRFGVVALKKQLIKYMDATENDVAFYFEKLTKVQRDALISHGIPFVSIPDQIYLPFLGLMLSNRFKKEKVVSSDKMMPATQCLFLYLLYNRSEYVIKKQAADDLKLTRTSITRASDQLKRMELIHEIVSGREVRMCPVATGRELYEKARRYLIDPVQKRIWIEKTDDKSLFVSGESMLSNHSMLGAPKNDIMAVYKGADITSRTKEVDPLWQAGTEVCLLELWKYDPALFATDGEVDPVSLALSLSDNDDERVQGELNDYLEEYRW